MVNVARRAVSLYGSLWFSATQLPKLPNFQTIVALRPPQVQHSLGAEELQGEGLSPASACEHIAITTG